MKLLRYPEVFAWAPVFEAVSYSEKYIIYHQRWLFPERESY
jgi:hypothetical protein